MDEVHTINTDNMTNITKTYFYMVLHDKLASVHVLTPYNLYQSYTKKIYVF